LILLPLVSPLSFQALTKIKIYEYIEEHMVSMSQLDGYHVSRENLERMGYLIELLNKYPLLKATMHEDYITNAFRSGWNIHKVCSVPSPVFQY
jgi:hypothetical protein